MLSKEETETDHTVSLESLNTLFKLTTPLVDIISQSEKVPESKSYTTVASILMSRHLPDLYASLLQLAYAPMAAFQKPEREEPEQQTVRDQNIPLTPGNMFARHTVKKLGLSKEERDKCARMFMWLFDRSDLSRAMESLMSLLSTSSSLHPVPNWLRTMCGRFLSRILLKPNGVSIVLEFTIGHVDQCKLVKKTCYYCLFL